MRDARSALAAADTEALNPGAAAGAFWREHPLLVGAWALAVWLGFSMALRPLTLPEEGRYVGVAWEMLRSGDWLVPTQNGLPFFHKPPLFYWITAASMQLFGPSPAAERAAPWLGAMLGALGLMWFLRRRASEALALWVLPVLGSLPFFFGGAQFANLDMLVAGCIALTLLCAADSVLARQAGEPHRRALYAAWAAAGLGVLAKGLIGLVLPGLVLVLWLLLSRRPGAIVRLVSPLGVALFLLVAAPWFIAVQLRYPGFAHYFFVYQHFERFVSTGFNNTQPWWLYVAAVPALAAPWSLWLVRAARAPRAEPRAAPPTVRLLMWVWLIAVLAFFSVPQSKPVGYAMPVLFPLAALAADAALGAWRSGRPGERRAVLASFGLAAVVCLCAVIGSAVTYRRDNTVLAHTLANERGPDDPIVFVGEYFFDVAVHARLRDPVPVTGDWRDPRIAERDNWRRELAEAAQFAPALAATVLVDPAAGLALRCGTRPLWAVLRADAEPALARLPGAARIAASNRAALWRLAPAACGPTPASP